MNEFPSADLVDRVEAKIRALFTEGLLLTPDVCQYIEATLGAADPATVAELLAGPEESERDTLLQLVFFPDADFQHGLETVLGGDGFAATDRFRLAERLTEDPAITTLVFPENPQRLKCRLPIEGVDAFLSRLNLTWSIAPRLRESIAHRNEKYTSDVQTDIYALMVKLRNADLGQSRSQVRFLMDFLERMPPNDNHWEACFDFLMAFLSEHGDHLNYYRVLMARKTFLVHHLIKARRNAEMLARSNMETLSMGGFRAAHFDTAAAKQALACIDAVALAVYGRTEYYDDAPVSMDLGRMGDASDIGSIVRRLT